MLGSHLASEWGSAIGKGTGAMSFLAVKGHRRLGAFMQKGVELDQENALREIFWYWWYRRDSRHPLNHGSGVSSVVPWEQVVGLLVTHRDEERQGKGRAVRKTRGSQVKRDKETENPWGWQMRPISKAALGPLPGWLQKRRSRCL